MLDTRIRKKRLERRTEKKHMNKKKNIKDGKPFITLIKEEAKWQATFQVTTPTH